MGAAEGMYTDGTVIRLASTKKQWERDLGGSGCGCWFGRHAMREKGDCWRDGPAAKIQTKRAGGEEVPSKQPKALRKMK